MKLKTLIRLNEWFITAPTVNRSPDSNLVPTPGGFNDDSPNWDGIIRKHTDKVAKAWLSKAKKLYKNPEINEVGNPIQMTWKQAFREALKDIKVKSQLIDCGEKEIAPVADPVNFTPRI